MKNKSEEKIIERLKNGDPDSFRELVDEFKHKIINTCYRFVMNREDAEDVAQEVFIEVHRSIRKFQSQASLATWIYRIAVTKSLDFLRHKKRQKRMGTLKKLIGLDEQENTIPAPKANNPDIDLERRERNQILQEAINSLPDNQKVAISLSRYDELSNKEVAKIMRISISAVESLIHRAKIKLQKKLEKYYKNKL